MKDSERDLPPLGVEDVQAALAGEAAAVQRLVDALTPVVQARAARSLLRRPERRGRNVANDVADMTQEVFVMLFSSDAKALKAWDPARGMSLLNFVGLLAERRVASLMRGKWAGRELDLSEDASESVSEQVEPFERRVMSRLVLEQLLTNLRATLSPLGLELFYLLYVQDCSIEEVCKKTGLSAAAAYQWKSRLGQTARAALKDLQEAGSKGTRPATLQAIGQMRPADSRGAKS